MIQSVISNECVQRPVEVCRATALSCCNYARFRVLLSLFTSCSLYFLIEVPFLLFLTPHLSLSNIEDWKDWIVFPISRSMDYNLTIYQMKIDNRGHQYHGAKTISLVSRILLSDTQTHIPATLMRFHYFCTKLPFFNDRFVCFLILSNTERCISEIQRKNPEL